MCICAILINAYYQIVPWKRLTHQSFTSTSSALKPKHKINHILNIYLINLSSNEMNEESLAMRISSIVFRKPLSIYIFILLHSNQCCIFGRKCLHNIRIIYRKNPSRQTPRAPLYSITRSHAVRSYRTQRSDDSAFGINLVAFATITVSGFA